MLPPLKPFGKPQNENQSNNAFSSSSSSSAGATTTKTWDFTKQAASLTPPSTTSSPPVFQSNASFLQSSSASSKKFDFSSQPPAAAAVTVAPPVAARTQQQQQSPRPAWNNNESTPGLSRKPFSTAAQPMPQQQQVNAMSKRPRMVSTPPTISGEHPASRSLVVTKPQAPPQQQHDEPFLEVSNVIQTQTRKIKELETQLREHGFLAEQLREKLEEGRETAKQATNEISELTQQLARAEKTSEHKDNELAMLKLQLTGLENDRARMMSENVSLSKAMQEEKKQFVLELKRSSDIILTMQGIRAKLGGGVDVVPEQQQQQQPPEVEQSHEQEKVRELEKQMEEAEAALNHYDQCYQMVLQIVDQCPTCAQKMTEMQQQTNDGTTVTAGNEAGGEEETREQVVVDMECEEKSV